MSKGLIIVESPTKTRTIKKYLGPDFEVAASLGHIKDLPEKKLGISIEDGFKPEYGIISGKEKVVRSLQKAASGIDDIYLAPDPDREGEAIAWHIAEELKKKGRRFHRVLFHELTENAIRAAMESPEELNANKFDSQQARRILDRLVGYQISPVLWDKVRRGLSAGRVQSVAVRIICERERAIQAFVPREYWSITAELEADTPPSFLAKLTKKHDQKLEIPDQAAATSILEDLHGLDFKIDKIVKKAQRRNPLPPFTTSKLQQEAIRRLRFSAKKTMLVAQQLYEGIEIGPQDQVGLITYMRTDSTRIAQEAVNEARQFIAQNFSPEYLPKAPLSYRNKKKVQDAHEAIRPSSVFRRPEELIKFLTADQLALYELIWKRFVACQMEPAIIDQTSVSIGAGPYTFQATGSSIRFMGFMTLYDAKPDTEEAENEAKESALPRTLVEQMELTRRGLEPKQHFTQPPARFSEASLVKELEENGIGRPSTFATILSTIRTKGYVDLIKGYFRPTELGFIVNDLLVESFPDIFNVDFTARMEDNLDKIEEGTTHTEELLTNFHGPFTKDLERAQQSMRSVKVDGVPVDAACPSCEKQLRIKVGKNGPFLGCSGYPECTFTRNFTRNEKGGIEIEQRAQDQETDQKCEKCGSTMVIKQGRYGQFLACSGYPECKNTASMNGNKPSGTPQSTGVKCPEKGCTGELVSRTSKRGKIFYGCTGYPGCTFALWDKPIPRPCPECNAPFVVEGTSKKEGVYWRCIDNSCPYKEPAEDQKTTTDASA